MRSAWAGLATVVALTCGISFAQQAGQQPGAVRPQAGQSTQASNADQQIAALIFGACHNEVETAKFAQSRLQTSAAKQFAEKMIKDHTPDCEVYHRWAGNLANAHEGQNREAQGRAGGSLDWVSIHNEIGQQCLESAKKELSQKSGNEIDHCFMGEQLAAHMAVKDKLTVLKQHASPQLAQQIDKSLEVVDSHLKEAKQIMEQLKDHPSERVSRRPDGNK
jgi:predicted outer membrane protein